MRVNFIIKTAVSGLTVNKTRSALTMLGIVIGVASILLIVSIGRGAEGLIQAEIQGFGADMIVIRPGKEPTGVSDIAGTLFADSLRDSDVEALSRKSNVPHLVDIVPVLLVPASASYQGETYRKTQIMGWSAEFMGSMFDMYPEKGVIFDDIDIKQRSSVAVLGSQVKKELFGESDAVGQSIKIKDRNFRVVGVYPPRGQVSFFNMDDVIIVPYTTAQTYLLGIKYYHEIMTRAESADLVERTVRDIELTLREAHNISDPEDDDFFVVTQAGVVDQIGSILSILTAFLTSVVAIALVVGGIGVMNIMLVSVTERTKEIGLRKAIGATNKDILWQFIAEASILTGLGGLIGVFLGVFFAFLISLALINFAGLAWVFTIPFSAVFLGVGVSMITGLIFGIYPARKASKKSPIDALRYE
jgi:putative ABC transport system permease protein